MKKLVLMAFGLMALFSVNANASDYGTVEEAKAMAEAAAAYVKEHGAEKAFEDFSAPISEFKDGDLYVFAYDTDGVCKAHGAKKTLIGRNLSSLRDPKGYEIIKGLLAVEGEGWIEYYWNDPLTNKVTPKKS